MKSEQPASPGRPALSNLPDIKPDPRFNSGTGEPDAVRGTSVRVDAPPAVTDEVIKLIRKLTEEKPKASKIQRFFGHSLATSMITLIVGFFLTGALGGFLTHLYSLKQMELENRRNEQQQELARRRSFSDEVNKIRIQKIGEVWEQFDQTEAEIDSILNRANTSTHSNEEAVDSVNKIVEKNLAVLNKNRFWLGEQPYNRVRDYMDIEGRYALDKLLGNPGIDLSDAVRKREQAKQDILQIRNMFLKGESEY